LYILPCPLFSKATFKKVKIIEKFTFLVVRSAGKFARPKSTGHGLDSGHLLVLRKETQPSGINCLKNIRILLRLHPK